MSVHLSGSAKNLLDQARGLFIPLLVLIIWQGVTANGWVNPHILPSPLKVVMKWWEYLMPLTPYQEGGYFTWLVSGELIQDAYASLFRVIGGFAMGTAIALPLGLLMGANRQVYSLLNPLFQLLRPIPPIAYIPLAILWFGLGNPPAFFLISMGAFFPVLMNTIAGVKNVDSIYLRVARNLGAGKFTTFTRIIVPAAMPYILTGMRIGMGTAFIVVIVAEMIAVNNGLGYRILEAREYMWSDKIIAGMFTIGLFGLGIDGIMNLLNNHLLRWRSGIDQR
ncbi:MAG: ABC transporter permease [Pseudomonadota bacterium]